MEVRIETKGTIVLAGGNGYIGKCTAYILAKAGFTPILLDNFSTSHKSQSSDFKIHSVDVSNLGQTAQVFETLGPVTAIMHFAASALVPESVEKPFTYLNNNINATLSLAECAVKFNIPHFIHSSSCAIYGVPKADSIREDVEQDCVTPYGESKAISEQILKQFSRWKKMRAINLRYFNPAGALVQAGYGEDHDPETHLIPNLVLAHLHHSSFKIFGDQHPTPDGSCVRDFIHIEDLAKSHLMALEYLERNPQLKMESINVGSGKGVSVKEALQAAEKVFGTQLKTEIVAARDGDPPVLVANTQKMEALFKWKPSLTIETMIRDHWNYKLNKK